MRSKCMCLLAVCVVSACATALPPERGALPLRDGQPQVMMVNQQGFTVEVKNKPGTAVVLFYNDQYPESRFMEERFDRYSATFGEEARFLKFPWDIYADGSPYGLEMLPTVVLYRNGAEVDRIKGIPPDERSRDRWDGDLELWFQKNVYEARGDAYSGDFRYRFDNGYSLKIEN